MLLYNITLYTGGYNHHNDIEIHANNCNTCTENIATMNLKGWSISFNEPHRSEYLLISEHLTDTIHG